MRLARDKTRERERFDRSTATSGQNNKQTKARALLSLLGPSPTTWRPTRTDAGVMRLIARSPTR